MARRRTYNSSELKPTVHFVRFRRQMASTPHTLQDFLSYRLHLLNKITDRESSDAYNREFGLPVGEARCLAAIGNFAPLSVNDLAQKANLNKGQASRAAQALVEYGYVLKESSELDGRGVVLTLTDAGIPVWVGVMNVISRRNHEIFGCLTALESKTFGALLDRLISSAKSNTSGSSQFDGAAP